MIKRYGKYQNVPGLDKELDNLVKEINNVTGTIVEKLPPVSGVKEFVKFFIKNSDGNYDEYMKIADKYHKQVMVWQPIETGETVDTDSSIPSSIFSLPEWTIGTTAERPSGLGAAEAGKRYHYDTDTQALVYWIGTKWSDQ